MTRRTLLLWLSLIGLTAVSTAFAAESRSRASTPEMKKAILATIESQLAAFRKKDVAKAYLYASADLRAQKPLRTFSTIVRESYPEIWANTRAEFGIVRDDGAHATVTVQVYTKEADAAYDFSLVKEPTGWRINGVVRHEPKQAGKV